MNTPPTSPADQALVDAVFEGNAKSIRSEPRLLGQSSASNSCDTISDNSDDLMMESEQSETNQPSNKPDRDDDANDQKYIISTYHEGRKLEELEKLNGEWTRQMIMKATLIPLKNLKAGTQSRY